MRQSIRFRHVWCAAAVVVSAAAALASAEARSETSAPGWMSESELENTFVGAEITGAYRDGRTFNEKYDLGGTLVYTEHTPSRQLTGTWSIVRGLFCTIYINTGNGGCFRVHRVGTNCFEFYFETRTEADARNALPRKPSWTAQAWRVDAAPTCTGEPSA
jgi:hypothetical protein